MTADSNPDYVDELVPDDDDGNDDDSGTIDGEDLSNPLELLPPFGETDFDRLSTLLRAESTRIVYVGVPDPRINNQRRWWNLWGNYSGNKGLELGPHVEGLMHAAFELLLSQGPYELGAVYQRTTWKPKTIKMAVQVNSKLYPDTSFGYRMAEEAWWNSWSDSDDGWLGVWTRTHGWRWIKVRQANDSKTAFTIDPADNNGNFMEWDMDIVALYPYYAKQSFDATWKNPASTSTAYTEIQDVIDALLQQFSLSFLDDAVNGLLVGQSAIGEGKLSVVNRGSVAAYPKYLISPPGIAWVPCGDRMVQLPLLTEADGLVMVDTDPDARTFTCASDPVDPLFYQILRNSEIIEVILGDVVNSTEPVWKRFTGQFDETAIIPPYTSAVLPVRHSQNGGTVQAIIPTRFHRAYA
jgi:hypothetical protein